MNLFETQYYHRNMATEVGGMIYGKYAGSVKEMTPGGLSLEHSYMPHGESYEAFKKATTADLEPVLAGEGSLGMYTSAGVFFLILIRDRVHVAP